MRGEMIVTDLLCIKHYSNPTLSLPCYSEVRKSMQST